MSVTDGLAAPKPPSQVSAGITISGRNSVSGTVFIYHNLHMLVIVTMVEASPGALGRNPTRRTDRCNLRYGLDQSHSIDYRQFRQKIVYLLMNIWTDCRS